jgi:hypothetical protein
MDAIDSAAEALLWVLVTRLAIGGARDGGGGWLDFLVAAAEHRAV